MSVTALCGRRMISSRIPCQKMNQKNAYATGELKMPNINRTDDISQQKESLKLGNGAIGTGAELQLPVERGCLLTDVKVSALGLSGTPVLSLRALRFVPGTGGSSFAIGTSFAPSAFGTSGVFGFSMPATGSTTLNLQKGDVLVASVSGTN